MIFTGTITQINEVVTGQSAKGEWKKIDFLVDSGAEYDSLACFEMFGADKVDNLLKYNKVGDTVTVDFNIRCREHNGRHYTNLGAWKVFKASADGATTEAPAMASGESTDDLPF